MPGGTVTHRQDKILLLHGSCGRTGSLRLLTLSLWGSQLKIPYCFSPSVLSFTMDCNCSCPHFTLQSIIGESLAGWLHGQEGPNVFWWRAPKVLGTDPTSQQDFLQKGKGRQEGTRGVGEEKSEDNHFPFSANESHHPRPACFLIKKASPLHTGDCNACGTTRRGEIRLLIHRSSYIKWSCNCNQMMW